MITKRNGRRLLVFAHLVYLRFLYIVIFQSKRAHALGAIGAIYYMDPQEYAKKGVDKVYPKYNWMPSTGVQRGTIKSTPIRGDPQTPGFPSIGTKILIHVISKRPTFWLTLCWERAVKYYFWRKRPAIRSNDFPNKLHHFPSKCLPFPGMNIVYILNKTFLSRNWSDPFFLLKRTVLNNNGNANLTDR